MGFHFFLKLHLRVATDSDACYTMVLIAGISADNLVAVVVDKGVSVGVVSGASITFFVLAIDSGVGAFAATSTSITVAIDDSIGDFGDPGAAVVVIFLLLFLTLVLLVLSWSYC